MVTSTNASVPKAREHCGRMAERLITKLRESRSSV